MGDTLEALCRTIVPAAYEPPGAVDLAARVAERVDTWDARRRRQFPALVRLIGGRAAALLFTGRPIRFARMTPERRAHYLSRWERSRIPLCRTVFQALRRTMLTTYSVLPESFRGIGYLGPFNARAPVVSWEGPLPGAPPGGPVADGVRGTAASRLAVAARPTGTLRAQVCVVGSGWGGATAACRLAEAGKDVVVLEAGSCWTAEQFDETERTMIPALYEEMGNRSTEDLSIPILQGRCVGGGSTVNWMITIRAPDEVLDEWAGEHGMEACAPSEMTPVFEEVERDLHVATIPDGAHNPTNRIILDGARSLGWSARVARNNVHGCIRAGFCGLGCRYGAKQSAARTYLPRAAAAGTRIVADAEVERVLVQNGGTQVVVRAGPAGPAFTVVADTVVLAAGAVATPALLHRSGLGGPAVGRFLRLHPTTGVGGSFDREIYPSAGVPQSAYCDEFLGDNGGYGFWIEGPSAHPGLVAFAMPGFGAAHRALMRRWRRSVLLIVLVRDGADRHRSNGRVRVDRSGRPTIRYRLGPAERVTMRHAVRRTLELLFAAGATETATLHVGGHRVSSPGAIARVTALPDGPNQLGIFSAHANGTCRIGRDRRTSVCDPTGRLHGVPGVYVVDGSLMPTAPGVNPQETIVALATVLARRLADGP